MWFRKRKQKETPVTDAAAKMIASGIVSLQMKIARKLQHLEMKCNKAQKQILLLLFCAIFGSYCFYTLSDALLAKEQRRKIINTAYEGISVPPMVLPSKVHHIPDTTRKDTTKQNQLPIK